MRFFNKNLLVDTHTKEKNSKINPKVWKATTVNGAMEALYGKDTVQKFLDKPQNYITYNASALSNKEGIYHFKYTPMHLRIKSKKDIDSIAFFYTANNFPLMAVFNITSLAIPELLMVFSPIKSGNILAVAKGRDGKIYQSKPLYVESRSFADSDNLSTGIKFTIK